MTKCNTAEHALSHLRENKKGFDVVISDVHMPDMDGFKLLEHIGLEMDLPVISKSIFLTLTFGFRFICSPFFDPVFMLIWVFVSCVMFIFQDLIVP